MTAVSDDIVTACRQGDRGAQRRLYDRYAPRIHRLALPMVGRRDAEHLVQQTFLRVFSAINQFAGDSSFDTWLFRVAMNECLQHLRREQRRPITHELTESSLTESRPAVGVAEQELLASALDQLEVDLRSVFLLREVEGMSYREISQTTGVSEGTVASRLNRARRQLRDLLVNLGWEP